METKKHTPRWTLAKWKKDDVLMDNGVISAITVEEMANALNELDRLKEQNDLLKGENDKIRELLLQSEAVEMKTANILKSQTIRELKEQNDKLREALKNELHNKIMSKWNTDFGSIHKDVTMDAYTVSGFVRAALQS